MNEPLRSPDSNTQLLGQKVGEYRLLREVGRGGMGVVFEAVHGETGEKVAVKAIHEKLLSNLTAVQRFVAEARLMARVDHPGLTKVFDSGQLPGGRPYFVMEFLVGESLRDRLRKKGRLAQREAVAIGEAMARALAIAHEKGIVHRESTPPSISSRNKYRTEQGKSCEKPAERSNSRALMSRFFWNRPIKAS